VLDVHGQLEQIATGFLFVEGPVWHSHERHLTFSDILGSAIHRWMPEGGVSTVRQPSSMANGNTYDRQGRLLTCEHATSRVTRTEGDGRVTVVASHYQGMELNSPNDIVVKSDGAVYFTDPNSGRSAKWGVAREQELPFQGVYRLDPDDGTLTLLVDDFDKPNGLCFSPDESHLFISDTNRYHIRTFEVRPDGTLVNGRVWAEMSRDGVGVPDGMKVDRDGNLYCTGPGGIHLLNPDAAYLGIIQIPEQATNLAWGDEDLCSLYVTATTSVYRLRATIPGRAPF
jgi:gluconolactonase